MVGQIWPMGIGAKKLAQCMRDRLTNSAFSRGGWDPSKSMDLEPNHPG